MCLGQVRAPFAECVLAGLDFGSFPFLMSHASFSVIKFNHHTYTKDPSLHGLLDQVEGDIPLDLRSLGDSPTGGKTQQKQDWTAGSLALGSCPNHCPALPLHVWPDGPHPAAPEITVHSLGS